MPITLTVPDGLLSPEDQARAFAGLTDALLEAAGLAGNAFMTANVIGSINVLPKDHVLAAGKPVAAAFIELKLPEIALATPEAKRAFIEKATAVVERAAGGRIRREHIWSNIVYAPEGAWGIAGRSFSNDDLIGAIQDSAAIKMRLSNYLFFTTDCEEALAFYTGCGLGQIAELKRHGEHGLPFATAAMRGKVLHARFEGPGVLFFASDNHDAEPMRGSAHILILDDRTETDRLFAKLGEGATVTTPLADQPWGSYYGKLTDRFGVQWMLDCPGE